MLLDIIFSQKVFSNLDLIVLIKPPPSPFQGKKVKWNPPGNWVINCNF